MRCRTRTLICFWLSSVVFVSSAWKTVSVTINAGIQFERNVLVIRGSSSKRNRLPIRMLDTGVCELRVSDSDQGEVCPVKSEKEIMGKNL